MNTPAARFVHIVRDPRDVVRSLLEARETWGEDSWIPRRAGGAAALWQRHVEGARQARAVAGADRYYELRYEDLVADPVASLAGVLTFLGLDSDQAGGLHATESAQAGEVFALAPSVRGRLRHGVLPEPDGFRSARTRSLSPEERAAIWEQAGDLMAELGYGSVTWVHARPVVRRALIAKALSRSHAFRIARPIGLRLQQRLR